MGGLYGHIHHIYDNPELSFGDIKNIYYDILYNKIKTYEKTDGQNIFFSFSLQKQKVLFARNKTNIKSGGLLLKDIQTKWSENQKVLSSFELAYKVLDLSLNKLSNKLLEEIFGNNNQYWFSTEIINKLNPNVIHYNRNLIILHESCYTFDDNANKSISTQELTTKFNLLCEIVGKTNYKDWEIWKPVSINLKFSKQKEMLSNHFYQLNIFMAKNNLQDYDKIEKFIKFKCPTYDNLSKKNKHDMYKVVLEPLEKLTFNFACDVLSKQKSLICLNADYEIDRLRSFVEKEIIAINNSDEQKNILQTNLLLSKIEDVNRIDCSMEGITFEYKSKIYKLTGYFSIINAILGIRRYII